MRFSSTNIRALAGGLAATAATLSAATLPAKAATGEQIGEALLIENLVTADYARETRSLQAGDGVRQDERIEVGLDARSEFHLNDDTKLALGPGSKVVLDRFVYDPDTATGSIILDMSKGAMRWVTGVARKPTYVIRTPNASITVRGTIFDLFLTEEGDTWLLLHEGAVEVCNAAGQCKVHDQTCKLTRVAGDGTISGATSWANLPGARDNMFHRAFPFVAIPPGIAPEPGCSRDAIMNQRDASLEPPPVEEETAPPPAPKVQKASTEPEYEPTAVSDEPVAKPAKRNKPLREARAEPEEDYPAEHTKPRRKKEKDYDKQAKSDDDDDDDKPSRAKREKSSRVVIYKPKRDKDDDDDDYDERPSRGGSGVGKALLGAAIVGGAIALGRWGGRHGGY